MTPFTVSNHSLGIILSCQRAGYFYKIRKRVRAREDKPGADAGSAVHAALARYYGEAVSMNIACDVLADHKVTGEDYRTSAFLSDALRAYEKHWGDDRTTFKTVAVEMPFEIGLSSDVLWTGRIDRVFEHPDGRLIIQDHKSGSRFGNADLDRFERSVAMVGYCYAASKILGKPVVTTELNSITMRAPLQKERSGSAPRHEFHRAQFCLDEERTLEWVQNTLRAVTSFLRAVETNTIITNENSCVNGFAGRCQYWDVCTQPIANRETALMCDLYEDYKPKVAALT